MSKNLPILGTQIVRKTQVRNFCFATLCTFLVYTFAHKLLIWPREPGYTSSITEHTAHSTDVRTVHPASENN